MNKISHQRPPIVYMHPYELDIERYPDYFHEALVKTSISKRLLLSLYRYKKDTVESKLSKLTQDFRFEPLIEIIRGLDREKGIPTIKI